MQRQFVRAFLAASLAWFLLCTLAGAQPGRPGGFSPGPSGPSPGGGGFNQGGGGGYNRGGGYGGPSSSGWGNTPSRPAPNNGYGGYRNPSPSPNMPQSYGSPRYGGNPNVPGQPTPYGSPTYGGNYGNNPTAPGGYLANPFHANYGQPEPVSPHSVDPVYRALQPSANPQWQQAQNLARAGNVSALQHHLDQQLSGQPSIDGYMNALSALHQANASSNVMQPYRTRAMAMAQEQINGGTNQPNAYVAMAALSFEDRNQQQFQQATSNFLQRFPDNPNGHYFQGIQLLEKGDYRSAEASLRKAKALGMPEEDLALLLKQAIDGQRWIWQYALGVLCLTVAWVIGLITIFWAGKVLSRLTLRSLKRRHTEVATLSQRWIRWWYRLVINAAGLYYYVSLPMVVVLSVALPLSIGYVLLMVPVFNLWLVVLVLVTGSLGVLTALSGLLAAFRGMRSEDPGRRLKADEAPQLWQLTREVAEQVGTRPVDEVWLTPGTELAVIERGGYMRRMRDRGRRSLIVGLGVLQGMRLQALKAVLAHEYGHFQNRDTAGGDVALRVYQAMENFAAALSRRRKIHRWELAVHFLRLYHLLFRRLTFGASRLQEVLADRVAVMHYGASAFREGLTHAIRRSVEFDTEISRSVRQTLRGPRPALAFYHLAEPLALDDRESVETTVEALIKRRTTPDDSHPGPQERFAMAEKLGVADPPGDEILAWGLLAESPALVEEISQYLQKLLKEQIQAIAAAQADAVRQLSHYIRRQPDPRLLQERASIYLDQGKYTEALHDFSAALERVPEALPWYYGRAIAFKGLERFNEAIADLNKLLGAADKIPPPERFVVYCTLGQQYSRVGRYADALKAYNNAIALDGHSLVALIERSCAQRELGQLEQALAGLTQAIDHWPKSPEAFRERAATYDRLSQSQNAQNDRTHAAALEGRFQPREAVPAPTVSLA